MTGVGDLIAERYRVVVKVGSGSMGVVWQARDEILRRDVAVKELLLQPGISAEQADEATRRALREGRITARLHHPNAVAVYDVAEHDGRPCLVMEFVPSVSLADRLAEQGSLPVADVASIGRQVADALAAAHGAGIVHRDVKPGNVLLAEDGTAKLTDFGISRAAGDGTVTATGVLAGTPAYLAPEVVQGQDADFRSDVFSLGATLYAAVEGGPPFGLTDNPIAMLHKIATEQITPPQQAGVLTPALNWLLAADPADRPTMGQAQAALTIAVGGGPTAPPSVQRMGVAAAGGRRRHRTLGSVVVALVLIVAAILLSTIHRPNSQNTAGQSAGGAGTSTHPTTAPFHPTTSGGTTPTTATSPPATTADAPPVTSAQVSVPDQLTSTIVDYYRLVPGHLNTAWTWMTADYQTNHAGGTSGYDSFWANIDRVTLSGVSAKAPNSVTATIHYFYKNGRVDTELTNFGLVRQSGRWKIASSSVLSHHQT
jgi:serine/threonine protein kinase